MPKNGLFGNISNQHRLDRLTDGTRDQADKADAQATVAPSSSLLSSLLHPAEFLGSLPLSLSLCLALSLTLPAIVLAGATNPSAPEAEGAGENLLAGELLPSIPALIERPTSSLTESFGGNPMQWELLGLALICALAIFVLIAGWAVIRERRRSRARLMSAMEAIQTLQTKLDRSESLLNATDQLLIIWNGKDQQPIVTGNLVTNDHLVPVGNAILAFGNWLQVDSVQDVEKAISTLRATGQRFVQSAQTLNGNLVEFRGRTSGGRALVQLRILEGDEHDRVRMEHEAARQRKELSRLATLLNSMPMPVWSRDEDGLLTWANDAYVRAVDGKTLEAVLEDQIELLDQRGREAVLQIHERRGQSGGNKDLAVKRLPIIAEGKRKIFDVTDIYQHPGSVGIATDVSDLEAAEKALDRMHLFYANTLDQLTTPVAIFDSSQQLQFYNAAYSSQFKLDPAFLDTNPDENAILEKLRINRSLPEQANFHEWKKKFLSSYRDVEAHEHWWHLPDGQSLRVIAAPNPDAGVIYIFENVTERLDLEKRYNALIRMQSETLDHLNDGVVVFGSDGRLRMSNPAFSRLWDFQNDQLEGQPHVAAVLELCRRKYDSTKVWATLIGSVVGLEDKREGVIGRMECVDGRFLDYASIPLPDGATMMTFVDVTGNVTVERSLQERNEALLAADQLKNTFIQHVSYELRSPLTNIIGFTELLTSESFGSLNERQREYTDHIMTSSSSLLAIVNDILDLATIDAGIVVLDLDLVDPVDSIRAAAEGLQDRLAEKNIRLDISVAENMGEFTGDQKRVRQVLFNLISNAIAFSDPDSDISIVAERTSMDILFTVSDKGCGMPENYLDSAFDRFESRASGNGRGGAGLGLSIVKSFVELHGGKVTIASNEGKGTSVTCSFPIEPKIDARSTTAAAE
ncbi:ATP-binding protein [uncultured Cohaesibacter sp.]|uniref:PAS domain-containing sensor histidine kinase n=1 Tax=uncultured Cohaesibacter sp. TaxID=1002546 RepID=UPI0029C7331D|nr:ATP-binding protein [uncultured Cohaesibacter sp.]